MVVTAVGEVSVRIWCRKAHPDKQAMHIYVCKWGKGWADWAEKREDRDFSVMKCVMVKDVFNWWGWSGCESEN